MRRKLATSFGSDSVSGISVVVANIILLLLLFSLVDTVVGSLVVNLFLLVLEFSCESVGGSVPTQPLVLISSADSGGGDDAAKAQLARCQARASGRTPPPTPAHTHTHRPILSSPSVEGVMTSFDAPGGGGEEEEETSQEKVSFHHWADLE